MRNLHKKIAYVLVVAMIFTMIIPMTAFAAPVIGDSFSVAFENGNDTMTTASAAGVTATGVITAVDTGNSEDFIVTVTLDGGSVTADGTLTVGLTGTNTGTITTTDTVAISVEENDTPTDVIVFTFVAEDDVDDLEVTLTFSTGGASAQQNGEYTAELEEVVLEVTVPAQAAFQLDPYELKEKGQISGPDYVCTNSGETAVEIKVQLTATAADVIFKGNAAAVSKTPTVNTKDMYFEAVCAVSKESADYVYTDGKSFPLDTTDKDTEFTFVLPKGKSTPTTASFTFDGAMNPYAVWAASDIIIEGVYDIQALYNATYEEYSDRIEDLNVLGAIPTADVTIDAATTTGTGSYAVPAGDTKVFVALTIDTTSKPASITSIDDDNYNTLTAGTNYSYNATTGMLTLKTTAPGTYTIKAGAVTYTLTLTAAT